MQRFKNFISKEKLLIILYAAVIAGGFMSVTRNETRPVFALLTNKKIIVIDAGHGGWDPGKIGENGTTEKDINLQISGKLRTLLELSGSFVIMTRDEDYAAGDTKNDDLRARVQLAEEYGADLYVSIHQNSYSDSEVEGAQVFYFGGSEEGERLALLIQKELRLLDGNNGRSAMENNDYYVLKNTAVPAVIVECGFLSSYDESRRLKNDDYQTRIAWAVFSGIVRYYEER